MLTGHLLDEQSEQDLERLERQLEFGHLFCKDFELISSDTLTCGQDADGKIIDMLAEVRAFEFLSRRGFRDITKVRRKQNQKIVDFITNKNNQNYAVEVTRLGLSQSAQKKALYEYKVSTISYDAKCEESNGYEIRAIPGNERLIHDIGDAIDRKYPQIKEFCQRNSSAWRGILFISSGRDYFAAGRYENKDYELQPRAVAKALRQVWQSLRLEQQDFKYLHHVVIAIGRDLQKALVYPSLQAEA